MNHHVKVISKCKSHSEEWELGQQHVTSGIDTCSPQQSPSVLVISLVVNEITDRSSLRKVYWSSKLRLQDHYVSKSGIELVSPHLQFFSNSVWNLSIGNDTLHILGEPSHLY